jgi:hypothetical protein
VFLLSFILGASKKFTMVIEGESLLNDGAAIDSSTFCQNIVGCLNSCPEMLCFGTSPTLKIATSSPEIQYL